MRTEIIHRKASATDFEGLTGTISYADGNVPTKTVFINEFKDGESLNVTHVLPDMDAE